jgi:hypothetical protein
MEDNESLTKAKFTHLIERTSLDLKLSYMDAIIHVCDNEGIDLEDVRAYITPSIKEKLEAEAMLLNFLPKSAMLPID